MKEQLLRYSCLWLSLVFTLPLLSQSIKVVDENDLPLIGVLIYTDQNSTVTDLEGRAELAIQSGDSISFEFLGYKDLKLSLGQLESMDFLIAMVPDEQLLDEIVIIGRTDARELDLPYNVTHIKAESIFSSNAQNSADALALNSGAYVQKSQLGGGSPVLRGFEANKVLLVVDGVRMNNAIYRNGHLQNAITIDPAILQQMEVIYGPGSLLYGSEALGGVIHFRTQMPLLALSKEKTTQNRWNAQLRYNSADHENSAHVDHMYSRRKFGILTSFSYSKRADLRAGTNRRAAYPDFGKRSFYVDTSGDSDLIVANENENLQIGTGYKQLDFFQKYVYQATDNFKSELNLQYSTSSDIPRYDNLSEYRNGQLRYAEWYYGPQERLLVSPKFMLRKKVKLFDKITLIASFQQISESRYFRNLYAPELESQIEGVKVLGLTLDFNKRLNANQKLVYGFDFHYNDVSSRAQAETNTTTQKILSRYPSGGSQLNNKGAYVQHNWQNTDSTLVWANGVRYSNQEVNLLYDRNDPIIWPDYFYNGITSMNSAVVGISGLNIQKGSFIGKVSTGTAFRSPNVDDLAKIRVNGNEITVPNPDLDSEKVWNSEITLGYRKRNLTLGVTAFYTLLTDAIVRQNFTLPNGNTVYEIGTDTLDVTGNVNATSGTIKGLSFNLNANIAEGLSLTSSLNLQNGEQKSEDGVVSPLGHIPPTYGRNSLSYEYNNIRVSLNHSFNLWKHARDYGGSVDNLNLATPDGTPSWHTIGISSQFVFAQNFTLNLALENLTDIHYRPFASGVSAAGRHIVVALRYSLTK